MTCYKFTIKDPIIKNPNTLLISLLNDLFNEPLNTEVGFMFITDNKYPKDFYVISEAEWILNRLRTKVKLIPSEQPKNFIEDRNIGYIGNNHLFEL